MNIFKRLQAYVLSAWLQFAFRYNLKKYTIKPGSFFDYFFKLRAYQAIANAPKKIIWVGDSRMHEFEPLINAKDGQECLAVSGSKVDDWLARGVAVCKPAQAQIIIEDIGGNNMLGGEDVFGTFVKKQQFVALMKTCAPHVLTFEIVYLGASMEARMPGINAKVKDFNDRLAADPAVTLIRLNDLLSDGSVMLPKYDCGDGVHHSAIAFEDAYYPRLMEKVKELGL